MTLKQEEQLGVQVDVMRSLLKAHEAGLPGVPFENVAPPKKKGYMLAMRKLVAEGCVVLVGLPFKRTVGERVGYSLTVKGLGQLRIREAQWKHLQRQSLTSEEL